MNNEKLRKYAYLTVCLSGGIIAFILFFKYALFPILPFLIAWVIAFAVRPASHKLSKKLSLPQKPVSAVLALLVTLSVIAIASLAIWYLARELWSFLYGLVEEGKIERFFGGLLENNTVNAILGSLGEELSSAVYSIFSSAFSGLGAVLSSMVSAVPKLFFFVIITVVASVYFALDLEGINSSVKKVMPESFYVKLVTVKNRLLAFLAGYARSYLILMLISFSVLLLGLLFLRVKYALLLSLIIAVLDVLPVIGVGTVLLPWGILSFAVGDTSLGIGLLVLLAVHEIIRQVAEPKILGKSLGINPIITLVTLYVGFSVFGIAGLLLVPLVTVLIDVAFGKKDSTEVG